MKEAFDIGKFNQLYHDYYDRFLRFAVSYVRELPIAEDIVSEAFVAYWENEEKLLPTTNPAAYILTVVKNKSLNYLKHLQVRQQVEKELCDHEAWRLSVQIHTLQACNPDFLFSEEIKQIVSATLNRLPKKTRRIFEMSRYEGLSYREIAKIMHLSSKSIEFHIAKALHQLRYALKNYLYLFLFLPFFIHYTVFLGMLHAGLLFT